MAQKIRITYATLSADNEDLQRSYDEAAEGVRAELGKEYPVIVNGEERWREDHYAEPSPIDKDLIIGRFSQATPEDVEDAVAAARAFQLEWDRMGWQERVRILRSVADVMEDRLYDLAAMMAFEVGKNRLEALGDVERPPTSSAGRATWWSATTASTTRWATSATPRSTPDRSSSRTACGA